MNTQEKIIAALIAAFPGESETAIARRCGLTIGRFSNYKLGKRAMDVDAVIGCAQALGWDVRATVAQHEIETAPTPRVRALWKALGATATLLLVGVLGTPQAHAEAGNSAFSQKTADFVHYVRLNYYASIIRLLLARFLPRRKPANGIEAFACL